MPLSSASMGHDHPGRLLRAQEAVDRAGLDAVLVAPSADLTYLLGYDPPPLERLTLLIVRPGAEPVLLVPELEHPRATSSPAGHMVEVIGWRDGDDPYSAAGDIIGASSRLGASDRMWARHLIGLQGEVRSATFVPASSVLGPLRARKDEAEVHLLARAARAADEAFHRIGREGLEDRPETDVAGSIASHLLEAGHDSVAFTIVASGPNAASPHHDPGSRNIRRGDAVVLDFGGRISGYCSDISRTVSVREPSEELVEVHEVVRQAQDAAFRSVAPGLPAEEIDAVARREIAAAGYGEAFLHRTGHGIGLEEHEPPWIVAGNSEPLRPGMCFSIEPGIYLEGRLGVRIEDIVTLTEEGPRRLNNAPRDLVSVG